MRPREQAPTRLGAKMAYRGWAAAAYARRWWDGANPNFPHFAGEDCTNFASQCLLAGGLPMQETGDRATGWWCRAGDWSYSWSVAHSLHRWLLDSGTAVQRERAARLHTGDIIAYDFAGDGTFDHTVIVVGRDPDGEPLVAAHDFAAVDRPWPYEDSPAYTKLIRYAFLHISG